MDSRKERKSVCIIKVQQRTSNNENHERIICAMGSSNRTVAILLTLQARLLPMGPQRFLRRIIRQRKETKKKGSHHTSIPGKKVKEWKFKLRIRQLRTKSKNEKSRWKTSSR